MKFCLLTSYPSSAIQFLYYVQTRGLKFSDVIVVGDGGPGFEVMREYSSINGFNLYFVQTHNSKNTVALIRKIQPDVLKIITGQILRNTVLDIPRIGTVNTHAGILPDYRGIDSPLWAILEGGRLGVTVHFVDRGVDTGPLLYQQELAIRPGDTVESILSRNHHQNKWQAAARVLIDIRDGNYEAVPQLPEDGKQYFEMHPRLVGLVHRILQKNARKAELVGLRDLK